MYQHDETKKISVIPAILEGNYKEINEKVGLISQVCDYVHIDLCDGNKTPFRTWPFIYGIKQDRDWSALLIGDQGLPHWETVECEFDLLVSSLTKEMIHECAKVGAFHIIVHIHNQKNKLELLEYAQEFRSFMEISYAFDFSDEINEKVLAEIEEYSDLIDGFQVMGIQTLGIQGQEFSSNTYEKVKQLQVAFSEIPISVDGGITLEIARELLNSGVSRCVVGSKIMKQVDPLFAYSEFLEI
jgi:ribulose-phosphate 3-epimerase